MRVYSSCVLRYHISNMLERAPNICPAEMYAYQSTIQRNICIHMLDCPADMYAYDGCVYYCRTFYKAVRVGEEESGGHVL
jgi:benzoyl-CoA reductase/2-hydroxyglutaryl-CoA dehydratase subunit BcrC/BadD/HgdB